MHQMASEDTKVISKQKRTAVERPLKKTIILIVRSGIMLVILSLPVFPAPATTTTPTLEIVQHRAFDFFWNETDPKTGLTKDRAQNTGKAPDTHFVASTASTGYALAALPIGVTHGWITRRQGYARALLTLRFLHDQMPEEHGFYFHFVDMRTGERVWNSEISSIDTALLLLGIRAAASFWQGTEVQRLADDITDRVDWVWMQNGRSQPLEMGWKPKSGWLSARWSGYSEAAFLYLLALGAAGTRFPLICGILGKPRRDGGGLPCLRRAEPLFMAQMATGYLDLRGCAGPSGARLVDGLAQRPPGGP